MRSDRPATTPTSTPALSGVGSTALIIVNTQGAEIKAAEAKISTCPSLTMRQRLYWIFGSLLLLGAAAGAGYGTPLIYQVEEDKIAANGQTEQEETRYTGDQLPHLFSGVTAGAAMGFFLCALCCMRVAFSRNNERERSPADILIPSGAASIGATELAPTNVSTAQIVIDHNEAETNQTSYRR